MASSEDQTPQPRLPRFPYSFKQVLYFPLRVFKPPASASKGAVRV